MMRRTGACTVKIQDLEKNGGEKSTLRQIWIGPTVLGSPELGFSPEFAEGEGGGPDGGRRRRGTSSVMAFAAPYVRWAKIKLVVLAEFKISMHASMLAPAKCLVAAQCRRWRSR